ncbi:MAG: hypothetical protein HOP30_11480 [Cyclobacteriaceae bacterium]|nr:hypothetical protein [Cyclobacteriaceae bacterium]
MKSFLIKIKLIEYLTIELPISKVDFVQRLSSVTDKGDTGMFAGAFDIFSSSKNELKGVVSLDGFRIRRRRRIFDTNMNMAIATGTFKETDSGLVIHTKINGFNNFFILYYVLLVFVYGMIASLMAFSDQNTEFVIFLFLVIHAVFMFLIPYFFMRSATRRLKHELEREFFYLTKR